MNRVALLGVIGLAFSGFANISNYSVLVGKWSGRVEKNARDVTHGGNPSEGEVGTPVIIKFTKTKDGLEGESRLGKNIETWQIINNQYIWSDELIEVVAEAVHFEKIPSWIKSELELKPTDQIFAFKFKKCVLKKEKKTCTPKKDYPEGLDDSGHWIFEAQANQLLSHVLYEYADGKKRILTESLKKE